MKNAVFFHFSFFNKHLLKSLTVLTIWLLFDLSAHAAPLKKWTSTSSTDWNVAANWTPAGVPTAADSVIISFSTVDPVINSGVTAHAHNIFIISSNLTINGGGSLVVEGTYFSYAFSMNNSTVNNSGVMTVKRGFNGMDISTAAVFNNFATLNMGESNASPYSFTEEGIRLLSSGSFVNNAGGTVNVLRTGNNGILLFQNGTSFTNYGSININITGLYAPDANTADGIDVRGNFTNETSGNITITNTGANGMVVKLGGSCNNKGILKITTTGSTAGTADQHGIYSDGNFTNSGSITINAVPRNGIIQLSNTFYNSGSITFGNTGTIGNFGLVVGPNGGNFNNYSGGLVSVKSSLNGGVLVIGFGSSTLLNLSGGTINIDNVAVDGLENYFSIVDNRGALNIGTVGSIGHYGILNQAAFANQFSGNITVKNAAAGCIVNTEDPTTAGLVTVSFQNTGIITAGASGGVSNSIENIGPAEFTNLPCGQTTTWQRINNSGTFTNSALLVCRNTSANTNTGIFTNDGVIADPNNSFGSTSFTNNDLWVRPKAACAGQPMSPALSIGATNSYTVGTTWFNGNTAAGTYVQASNTFTPTSSLAIGNYELTFSATGNGCAFSVPIPIQIASPPDVNITTTGGLNYICPGGQITLQANVASSTGTPSYIWSNGATTSSINVTATGTYSVTVTQSVGSCTDIASKTIISDPVAPVAKCVSNLTVNLSSPSITASQVNNGSSDNCGIASMTLSKSSFDCSNVGANTVTLTVKDANNNSHSCTATVNVVDNIAPSAICQNVTVQLNSSGTGSTMAAAVNNGSSDNCGIASMTLSKSSFDCSNVGSNMVTLTVTDVNNNASNCSATVNVEDNIDPTAACQDVTVALNVETGDLVIAPEDVDNVSSDACGISSLSLSETTFTCADLGENTVTLTVEDVNGNTATCTATITVEPYAFGVSLPTCQTVYYGYAPASCATINSSVSGGASPFTYNWNTEATTASIQYCATSPISPSPFNVIVTDANGCTVTAPQSSEVNVVDIRCGNNMDKVLICHNGNKTLCVASSAVPEHLAHGDYLGECGATNPCNEPEMLMANPISNATAASQDFHLSVNDLTVFPNPASGRISFSMKSAAGKEAKLQVVNALGAVVLARQFDELPSVSVELNLEGFETGMYWLQLRCNDGEIQTAKFVVANDFGK